MRGARAPGKVMLSGEYAVLDGATALVLAVDRHARVRTTSPDETATSLPMEARAALEEGRAAGLVSGVRPMFSLDVSALNDGPRKLGLGSSAAAAVAALGLAVRLEGGDMVAKREEIARAARRGHRRAQGGGSGVDVLASALGGAVAVTLHADPQGEPLVERLSVPAALRWCVLWTGVPVRTSELLARVRALPAETYRARMGALREAASAFLAAFRAADVPALVDVTHAHREAAAQLGDAAGAPIVTESMRALSAALRDATPGVAIKPSGAGGGDVVLAFGASDEAIDHAVRVAEASGFTRLVLREDPHGVCPDDAV